MQRLCGRSVSGMFEEEQGGQSDWNRVNKEKGATDEPQEVMGGQMV